MAFGGIETDSAQLRSLSNQIASEKENYTQKITSLYAKIDELNNSWTTNAENVISAAAYSNKENFDNLGKAIGEYANHLSTTANRQESADENAGAASRAFRN